MSSVDNITITNTDQTSQIEITSTNGITVTTVGTQGLAGPSAIMARGIDQTTASSSNNGALLVYDHANEKWTATNTTEAQSLTQLLYNLQLGGGGATVTTILDEDNMASDSATAIATQQSIKAYIDDTNVNQDLDISDDDGNQIDIRIDTEVLQLLGGDGVTSSASGVGVTFAVDPTVARLTSAQTFTNKTLTSPVLNGTLSGTAFLDEDNFSSDSAIAVASQQSIKAYVDAAITAEDLDITDGSINGSIDLDSETFGILGGTGVTSSLSGNNITLAIDSTVATLTGTQTLTNKTLTAPVIATISNSGTVTLPTGTETLVGRATTDTLTNKTLTAPKLNGSVAITTTGTELNSLDGDTSASSVVIVDADQLIINDNGTMKQIAVTRLDTYVSGTTKTLTNKTLTAPVINSGVINTALSGTAFLDEDDFTSNSATKVASQQSIKAYVDANITAQDLDVSDGTTDIAIDLDSETLSLLGGTGLTSTASGNGVTFNIDSTVATLTGTQTLTNKTLDLDSNTLSNIEVDNLKAGVLDTDLSSVAATDTTIASAKAIKTYVDANITAQDLDVTDGSTTIAIDLDSETLSLLGGTGVTSTASGNGVTFAIGQSVGTTDNVSFGVVTADLTGNADTATALETARTIGGVSFDGTANINLAGVNIAGNQDTSGNAGTATALETSRTIGGVSFDGTADIAVNLSATATALATARSIALTGDVTATGVNFDGTGNITLSTTIAANSVALGTDTTGDYVGTIIGGTGIDSTGATSGEGIAHTLSLDLNELTTEATIADDDFIAMVDATDGVSGKITFENLEDAIFSSVSGDILIAEDGAATIQANSVALSTDTTGNYIATVTGTANEVEVTGSGSEGATITIGLPDDVTISGDLTVNGTTTTTDTNELHVTDPLIKLAKDNTANSLDIGFYGQYRASGTTNQFTGLFRDQNDGGKYKLFELLEAEPTTIVNTSGTGYATATLVANFEGNITGNVTGNTSGSALTVTQAAQTAITSLGTLTALQVDNININGNTISSTAGTDLNITPLAGQQIVLDGAITIDSGVITGASSITSTAFVGNITGDVTGNADTATTLATARTIGGTSFDGSSNIAVALAGTATTLATARTISGVSFDGSANITLDTDNIGEGSTNLYHTTARARGSISASGDISYNSTTGVISFTASAAPVTSVNTATGAVVLDTDDINEGATNVYFTNARVDARVTQAFVNALNIEAATVANNSVVLSTDTTGSYVESLVAGTGVTLSNNTGEGATPTVAIGQAVATSSNVTFNTVTADFIGDINGATEFTAQAGEALSKGDAVYISGISGNTPIVSKADADVSSKMPSFGLAKADANLNAAVTVVTFGTLSNLDTSSFTVGDILYISTTAGAITTTAPTGEASLIQNIGKVQRSHASSGSIKVGGAGRTNATPNLNDGKIFLGNGSNQSVTATLDSSVVPENTNLYYTTARANSAIDTRVNKTFIDNLNVVAASATGNAGTATTLETARNIGGTSFDGSADIAVALSATATALATARTIGGVSFDGTANIDLAGVNTTGNQDTSGNAATATLLATARTINGVSFNGSANITTLTAGTGVSVSGTAVSIGQAVATSSSPTFANLTLGGTDSIKVPVGTTSQRNASPANGMFRYNSTEDEFEGYQDGAWGAIAGGGGASAMETDNFTGDGTTTDFTLTSSVASEDNLMVFIEGVFQNKATYAASGTTIAFATAPANTRKIVVFHVKTSISGTSMVQDAFTGNGSTTAYTLSALPNNENNTQVYIDGVYQNKATYSTSGTTLTFDTAPANSAEIEVMMFAQTSINVPASNSVTTSTILDGNVTTDKINDNAVTLGKMAGLARGKIIYGDASGNPSALALGSANYVLTSDGTDVSWAASQVEESPTFTGNVAVGGTFTVTGLSTLSGLAYPTADGSNGQVLQTNGSGTLSFATVSGTTINNNADNRIITGSGTANTLNGEANLVFDGTNLGVGNASPQVNFVVGDGTNGTGLEVTPNESSGYVNMNAYDRGSSAWRTMNIGGDVVTLNTGGTERIRIDSAGNVGIGETSPKAPGGADATTLTVKANLYAQWISTVSGAATETTTWRNIVRNSGVYQIQTTNDAMSGENTAYEIARTSGSTSIDYQRWFAGTSEAMRITANGEFLLNRTGIFGSGNTCTAFIQGKSTAAMYVCGTNTSGYQLITFFNGGLNVMGSITHNNTTVTYGGPSDYRLKENVNYDFDATTRLKQLKPARFNWIADSDNIVQDGFLAHEVSAVVPEAVVGTKDATETVSNAVLNTEGNVVAQDITEEEWKAGKEDSTYDADTTWEASHTKIVQQNIDPAKLVPLLVKTIQELEARITTLENA